MQRQSERIDYLGRIPRGQDYIDTTQTLKLSRLSGFFIVHTGPAGCEGGERLF